MKNYMIKRGIEHNSVVFLRALVRPERFSLFHITKSGFIKKTFSNRSEKTICHRNVTDLFAARFTTLNING